jgi:hypothetical protein
MKIAMWSGPRNLSTALMYSFGNRADMAAWDEPFYPAYLSETGIDHPMRDAIVATGETDPHKVAARCAGPVPGSKSHWYMKHMGFHMCEGFPLEWASDCINIHLIRHPARVVASYVQKRENPTLQDIGFAQQAVLYDRFPGPVIDSADIRENPERMLTALCATIGLPFDRAMLSWPQGPKSFDGIWAAHWYNAVHRSTGFAGPETALPTAPKDTADLIDRAMPYYEKLKANALT